jgi:hypothetical protein
MDTDRMDPFSRQPTEAELEKGSLLAAMDGPIIAAALADARVTGAWRAMERVTVLLGIGRSTLRAMLDGLEKLDAAVKRS